MLPFYCTSGMSWKSALESSVPMDRAMKYVSTRLKNAFSEHGRTRTPRREARLISDTLRKPKPHTVEEQKQTRASITAGGTLLLPGRPVRITETHQAFSKYLLSPC